MMRTDWSINLEVLLLCALLSLSACTTQLTHEKFEPDTVQASPGFPYYLPKQRFNVVLTFQLSGCPNLNSKVPEEKGEALQIVKTAAITETSVADESQYFLLTYPTLNSVTKTTTFSATSYENKTIHTVGVQVEDRTSAIIKSFVGTSIGIAKMAIGIPAAVRKDTLCRAKVYDALNASRVAKAKLVDPSTDESAKAAALATITSTNSILQLQKTFTFVPTWTHLSETFLLDENDYLRWFSDNYAEFIAPIPASVTELKRTSQSEVRVVIGHSPPPPPKIEFANAGVVFRDPSPAVVEACMSLCTDKGNVVLAAAETQIAQLGRYMVLSLKNEAFDKNNLNISFAANGRLESLTFGSESRLEKAAASLADTVGQVEGFVDKVRASDQAKADAAAGAELKSIKAQTDLLAAKAALIEAQNKLRGLGGAP